MRHIKIYEEFKIENESGEELSKLLDNEINMLKAKGVRYEFKESFEYGYKYIDYDFINGQFIQKSSDGYYVLNCHFKCSSLIEAIRLAEKLQHQEQEYITTLLNRITMDHGFKPGPRFIDGDNVVLYYDNSTKTLHVDKIIKKFSIETGYCLNELYVILKDIFPDKFNLTPKKVGFSALSLNEITNYTP